MRDLVSPQRAAAARMLWPAEDTRFEERPIDNQLAPALEQIEQAQSAIGSIEPVLLLHGHPRHPPALGRQRIALARELLFLAQQVRASRQPFLSRHDLRFLHAR